MPTGGSSDDDTGFGRLTDGFTDWFLLDGNRGTVAALTALALFAFLAAVSLSKFTPLRKSQPLFYVFSGMLSGNLTVITVVVSINQLLLSRELRTPSQLRSQIDGVIEYRRDVEASAGTLAPVEPQGFLRLLYENTRKTAQQLGGLALSEADPTVYEEVDDVVTRLTEHADHVDKLLQERDTSTFDVLSVTLSTNYARDIHQLRRIRSRHGGELPEDVDDSITTLVDQLRNIDIARQYLKTIYLQEELASVSRILFYVGLPSIAIVATGLYLFTASAGASVSRSTLSVVLPAITTVGLVPLVTLFAFVVRIATVTQRTVATIPFTTPNEE